MSAEAPMISVEKVFKDYYEIPDFQREYRWTEKQAKELVEDICDWFYEKDGDDKFILQLSGKGQEEKQSEWLRELFEQRPYFLGLMVTSIKTDKDSNETYSLIDSQQRITTLFLLFCAIRQMLLSQGIQPASVYQSMLYEERTLRDGSPGDGFKLKPQYENDKKALKGIYSDGALPEEFAERPLHSHKNMQDVYYFFIRFLKNHFGESASLHTFAWIVSKGVRLTRINTRDDTTANTIFERINARGVSLTPFEMIKNQIFSRTQRKYKTLVIDKWKELTHEVLQDNEDPTEFLRYFVASQFTGAAMNEDKIFKWFKEKTEVEETIEVRNKTVSRIFERDNIDLIADIWYKNKSKSGKGKRGRRSSNMVDVVEALTEAAKSYSKFRKFQNPYGQSVESMENISFLGGNRMRQQNYLFMGARHLNRELFVKLADYTEKFIFHVQIMGGPPNFLERELPKWALELRKIQSDDKKAFNEFISNSFIAYMKPRQDQLRTVLGGLTYDKAPIKQKARAKYVLAKLAQHFEPKLKLSMLCQGLTYEIAQIVDVRGAQAANWASEQQLNMLGNLTLLRKDQFERLQNLSFDAKVLEFKRDELLMTRNIVSNQRPPSSWEPINIGDRQKTLADIGMQVWGIKQSSTASVITS